MASFKQIAGWFLVLVMGFLWGVATADMYCVVKHGFSLFGG